MQLIVKSEYCLSFHKAETHQVIFKYYINKYSRIAIRKMENNLEKVLEEIVTQPETLGCLISNSQGLCLGAKGKISTTMSGIGLAISEQACKLEPKSESPIICLYSGNKRCIIQSDGEITGVIYKQST